ncbi:LysR family transcriptional regulator [Caballeronia sp. LZ034LL]|uniref:LysR family transcriptional regulator n=1 Tax=Caballeronia sp. LZ034LL TaxID=3038567 RepID=UPI002862D77B|nr:LysR family transcriptional regulator [Caballeronia sp. LZ034LL]MDR5836074.1 LysR family transcriptional regulator [Caballeronia sp. LZ034LL]
MRTLDIDAVHAFVLTADLKSFTRAAEALDTTQATVSLKIGRLEKTLERRLLERTPRQVRLSADGSAFIDHARALIAAHQSALNAFVSGRRRLAIGVSHHVIGSELPALIRQLSDEDAGLLLEVRVAASRDLLDAFDQGTLDAAVILQHDSRRLDCETIATQSFGWMGAPDFSQRPREPLRVATQAAPCSVRSMAVDALDAAGIAWTEVFVGGGVSTIGAAVSAGLAVAALGTRVSPAGTVDLGPQWGLPALPARDIVLYSNHTDGQARQALRRLASAIRAV